MIYDFCWNIMSFLSVFSKYLQIRLILTRNTFQNLLWNDLAILMQIRLGWPLLVNIVYPFSYFVNRKKMMWKNFYLFLKRTHNKKTSYREECWVIHTVVMNQAWDRWWGMLRTKSVKVCCEINLRILKLYCR